MFDINHLLQSGGLVAIAALVYGESGLMIGFFFPGDTLLLSAGVFAAQGKLSLALTISIISLAAILGDNTGYVVGRLLGPRLFRKKDGIVFRQEYVQRAEKFYKRFGNKTMLLSHFIPFVRTFAPALAGVAKMPRPQFFLFDAIGDIVWAASVTLIGYWFGSKIPNLDHYILPVIGVVVVASFGPMAWRLFGDKTTRERLFAAIHRWRNHRDPSNQKDPRA
ncbi:MAG TPA: DedA family protein [Candidatus Saccharimonadales bacterium]|nr:DedA family protein [Candidatus Saccharimonadales bacterium]